MREKGSGEEPGRERALSRTLSQLTEACEDADPLVCYVGLTTAGHVGFSLPRVKHLGRGKVESFSPSLALFLVVYGLAKDDFSIGMFL